MCHKVGKMFCSKKNTVAGCVVRGLAVVAVLVVVWGSAAAEADGKGQSRMVFQPGSKEPDIHTDETRKPAGDAKKQSPKKSDESSDSANKAAAASEESQAAAGESSLLSPPPAPENLPPELGKVLDVFFGQLVKGNIEAAYSTLTRNTVLEREPSTLASLKASTNEALKLFGAFKGYEILGVEEVGTHMLRVSCISLGEMFPLSWKFFYYRPEGDWRLIDIRVGAALNEFFPERGADSKSSSRASGEGK